MSQRSLSSRPRATCRGGFITGLIAISLLLASASGLYAWSLSLPVVQAVGAAGVLGVLFSLRVRPIVSWHSVLLFALVGVSATYASIVSTQLSIKAPVGFCLGIVLMLLVRGSTMPSVWSSALTASLVIHAALWIFQFTVVEFGGPFYDYVEILTGEPSRYISGLYNSQFSGTVVRCPGLFGEPAQYASFVYMAVSARFFLRQHRLGPVDWIALLTLIFTKSLLGYAFAVILTASWLVTVRSSKSIARIAVFATALLLLLLVSDFRYVLARTQSLDDDGSAEHRIGLSPARGDLGFLFGRGLGSLDEMSGLYNNGVDFFVHFLGFTGTLIFVAAVGTWVAGRRPSRFALWIPVFFGAPLFTNPFWWIWSALLAVAPQSQLRRGQHRVPLPSEVYTQTPEPSLVVAQRVERKD